MGIDELIAALADPAAYPGAVDAVEVRQTHISAVFLAGEYAYKIKKPVAPGFLDYSTPEARRASCEREVILNRRLAPDVYLGVLPVTRRGRGVRVGGAGEVVEWAVRMRRLPDSATFLAVLERGELTAARLAALARRLAEFHAGAKSGHRIAESARFGAVAQNVRDNLEAAARQADRTISRSVLDRLTVASEAALGRLGALIEGRAERDVPRDTHGDLRLEHVYDLPGREPPGDLIVIDCIEFSERYRHADPVADAAFLAMELRARGRGDLADAFAAAYIKASGDEDGRPLWPFYMAYRAAVRGKVNGLKAAETEVPEPERRRAADRSTADWLLALSLLEGADRRVGLVLVGGLPGSGKSTLARTLPARLGFRVLRSDVVRKELAGLPEPDGARAPFGTGLYAPAWSERTYAECLRRAESLLFSGERVLVDASFGRDADRVRFLEAASRWRLPCVLLLCRAGDDVIRARLTAREGDASDADAAIFEEAARRWEPPSAWAEPSCRAIDSGRDPVAAASDAIAALRDVGLAGGPGLRRQSPPP